MTEEIKKNPFLKPALIISLPLIFLLFIRIVSPSDMAEYDQDLPTCYIQDALENGHYFMQNVPRGHIRISTKPPLYVWLAMPFVKVAGYYNDLAPRIPAIISFICLLALIMFWSGKILGYENSCLAPSMIIASSHGMKYLYTNRTDGLLAFWIAASFFCLFKSEFTSEEGRNKKIWLLLTWFCLGMGFLTKGPVALGVTLSGWMAYLIMEKRVKDFFRIFSPPGIMIFLLIIVLWLIPAYLHNPEKFKDVLIREEIIERLTGEGHPLSKSASKVKPVWYFLPHFFARMAPWSIIGICGVIFFFFKEQFLEPKIMRFICGWFFGGFVFFSVVPGKRLDYIYPLEPAMAIVASSFLVFLSRRTEKIFLFSKPAFVKIIVWLIVLGSFPYYMYYSYSAKNPIADNLKQFSKEIKNITGENAKFAITPSVPNLLIYYLGGINKLEKQDKVPEWLLIVTDDTKLSPDELQKLNPATKYSGMIKPKRKSTIMLIKNSDELPQTIVSRIEKQK